MTRSRKRGHFQQIYDCEFDVPADNAKSAVCARENRLTLAHRVPRLQSFEYHTRAYLGFEISAFISVPKRPESQYTTGSRYMCTMFGQLLLRNWAAANGHGGSPVHLVVFVNVALVGAG